MTEDIEIVRRVKRGETRAFARLVEKYHRHLLNFIFRLVRDESIVEDLGQEVFLSIFTSLSTFDERRSVPFAAWLFVFARNRCISELRRRHGKVFLPETELDGRAAAAPVSPEELAIDAEERQAIAATLSLLPEPHGMVYVLGDNREASVDSRAFGYLPLRDVVGKARQVYYSAGDGGVRWGRIGTTP